jgi:hypothetical protein
MAVECGSVEVTDGCSRIRSRNEVVRKLLGGDTDGGKVDSNRGIDGSIKNDFDDNNNGICCCCGFCSARMME